MAAGLLTGLIGGGLNLADRLFNKDKYKWQDFDTSNINLILQRLGTLPPSPQRDAAIQQLASGALPLLNNQQLQAYGSLMPAIEAYEPLNNQLIGQLTGPGGLASKLETTAGNNPYLTYYGKPGETEARLNDIKQRDVDAAFSEFGTKGGEALGRMGQVMSQNAQRGILNSGFNRRQMESERMRLQQAKNEALAQGEKFVQGTMQNVFSNYNDGLKGLTASLNAAGDAYKTAGALAQQPFQMRRDAAALLGKDYRESLGLQLDAEKQGRDERIQRETYNNNLANDEAKANFQKNLDTAQTNFAGRTQTRMNTASPIQSFMQGFSGSAPLGSYIGSLGEGGGGFNLFGGGRSGGGLFGGGSSYSGGGGGYGGSSYSGGYGGSSTGSFYKPTPYYGGTGSTTYNNYGSSIGDYNKGGFWNS